MDETSLLVWGMLKNTGNGRWHPIVFRPSYTPSSVTPGFERYRSTGHHTSGFDTELAAKASIDEHIAAGRGWWSEAVWEWNGEGIPTMTEWFKVPSTQ